MTEIRVPLLRLSYTPEEIASIKEEIGKVLSSGYLTMGDRVREFERRFADFCGTRFALGTNSGTSVLEIALRANNVEGGTVIMPSNTYMATPLAAVKAGANVIFTDCERNTLQMDPDDLQLKIRDDTRAVVLVHIGGIISGRLDEIRQICDKQGLPLIEDAAHAHGAEFNGKRAGSLGLAGGFSFYPTKVLTTAEGGMLTTNDVALYEKGVILREHGKADHALNVHTEIGDNWRYSELHAVLGLQQMDKADAILAERRRLAARYDALLKDVEELTLPEIPACVRSAYYKYIVFLPEAVDRAELKKRMQDNYGVMLTGEVYSDPCHSQPVFQKYPAKLANDPHDVFPNTDYVCARHICLPLYPGLEDEEVRYVVASLKECLTHGD